MCGNELSELQRRMKSLKWTGATRESGVPVNFSIRKPRGVFQLPANSPVSRFGRKIEDGRKMEDRWGVKIEESVAAANFYYFVRENEFCVDLAEQQLGTRLQHPKSF